MPPKKYLSGRHGQKEIHKVHKEQIFLVNFVLIPEF